MDTHRFVKFNALMKTHIYFIFLPILLTVLGELQLKSSVNQVKQIHTIAVNIDSVLLLIINTRLTRYQYNSILYVNVDSPMDSHQFIESPMDLLGFPRNCQIRHRARRDMLARAMAGV